MEWLRTFTSAVLRMRIPTSGSSRTSPIRRSMSSFVVETAPRPVVIAIGAQEEEDLRAKVKRAIGVDLFK